MSRYYFNIYNGQDIFDYIGVELGSTKAARKHMLSVAIDLFEKIPPNDHPWQMEVIDEAGKIVGTMDFGVEAGPRHDER